MAKPSWLLLDPTTGSGNGTIGNSSQTPHTGRVARTGIVTVTATGVETPVTYKVTQSPKSEFVSFDNGAEMAVDKAGGQISVAGKSNASKLTFAWTGGKIAGDVEIPETYQTNGVDTTNGVEIEGDPGATAEYAFSIVLNFPENDTIEEIVKTLMVTTTTSKTAQIALKQAAGDPYLYLGSMGSTDPVEITLTAEGTPVTVNVFSNASWSAS